MIEKKIWKEREDTNNQKESVWDRMKGMNKEMEKRSKKRKGVHVHCISEWGNEWLREIKGREHVPLYVNGYVFYWEMKWN